MSSRKENNTNDNNNIIIFLFTAASNKIILTPAGLSLSMYEISMLTHALQCILFLGCNFILTKFNINIIIFW
jgi:hypothetical protein